MTSVYHGRDTWEDPARPISGPSAVPLDNIESITIHYPGSTNPASPDPTAAEMPGYMRAMQHDYTENRGYSLGYNWVVDTRGEIWEARGWTFRNAANAGKKAQDQTGDGVNRNSVTLSIQLCTPGQSPATDRQIAGAQYLIGLARAGGAPGAIICHTDIDYTICPGEGVTPQVRAGDFEPEPAPEPKPPEPAPEPAPEPEPEPEPELEDDMAIIYVAVDENDEARTWLAVFGSGSVLPLTRGMPNAPSKTAVPTVEYDALRRETALDV